MARPKWKGPYITKINEIKNLKKTYNFITISRNTEISSKFLGLNVKIHNGKNYIDFIINKKMIGHKFGEFAATREQFFFKK